MAVDATDCLSRLEARRLSLRPEAAPADVVRDLSLSLAPGEILAVVGPNGAGKSTALAALARSLPPREGSVRLAGVDVWGLPARGFAREVARLPQEPRCPEGMTAAELVRCGRHPHRRWLSPLGSADLAAVAEATAWLDVAELGHRAVATLSGGERRRVWLAMALAQGARFLLLDEPTAGLDLRQVMSLLELLGRLRSERGLGLAVVLHDLEQAARVADRVALVHAGRLYAVGPPRAVLDAQAFREVFGVEVRLSWDGPRLHLNVLGPATGP